MHVRPTSQGGEMANDLKTLSPEELIKIHEILVREFNYTPDPISPAGVKSISLLESAVGRQFTSLGSTMKYPDPLSNAATLVYGVCCDHPFHNGNKRTGLVAMLVHLDKNHLALFHTGQSDLYKLMLSIAEHSIGVRVDPRNPKKPTLRRHSDDEVQSIKDWLLKRVDKVRRGERQITYRELRKILKSFGFEMDVVRRNSADIYKFETEPITFLKRNPKTLKKRIGNIGYVDEGTFVSIKDIKLVRRICNLSENDGVDHDAFYNEDTVIDSYVNHYRTVLRRLAKV